MKKENNSSIEVSNIILEGKKYIYKFNHLEWTKYVIDSVKDNPEYIAEFEATIWIMEKLANSEINLQEMTTIVKDMDFSTERLYHIVNNILYYYKEGPEFFKTFYNGYMNPQLELMVNKINVRNDYFLNLEKQRKKSR